MLILDDSYRIGAGSEVLLSPMGGEAPRGQNGSRHCGCDSPGAEEGLVPIDTALRLITEGTSPIALTETLSLAAAVGRVLAAPVTASAGAPPFDNAAMDGYAINVASLLGDGPWWLEVRDRYPAGSTPRRPLDPCSAARILTGAPVPSGANAVIMQEAVLIDGSFIRIDTRPSVGSNVRIAGEDLSQGQTVLESGCRLGPREIAAAAAAGAGFLRLRARLRVGLMVTGDEVREAGGARESGEIWDINTPMLSALIASTVTELCEVSRIADNRDGIARQLNDLASRVDLIVTTGGISVGEEDHVKPALTALGADMFFSGVAIKPGKPVSVGRVGGAMWLGLPGNPLSAYVAWQLFGIALVRRLTGRAAPPLARCRRHVVTERAISRKPGRCELRPAMLAGFDAQGREVVQFDDATHSGRVGTLPATDGLMFLPAEADHLPAGAIVEFQPFGDE